jgi:hypothetical protein
MQRTERVPELFGGLATLGDVERNPGVGQHRSGHPVGEHPGQFFGDARVGELHVRNVVR